MPERSPFRMWNEGPCAIYIHLFLFHPRLFHPANKHLIILPCIPGRCGHGSPCEQLCYELHDGMYECDCKDGYILHKNGYSCAGEFTSAYIPFLLDRRILLSSIRWNLREILLSSETWIWKICTVRARWSSLNLLNSSSANHKL